MTPNDTGEDKVEIDVSAINTSVQFHSILMTNFQFPDYYGMNWNAFWDLVSKYVVLPREVVFRGWANIETKMPNDAKYFKYCINQYNNDDSDYQCTVKYL